MGTLNRLLTTWAQCAPMTRKPFRAVPVRSAPRGAVPRGPRKGSPVAGLADARRAKAAGQRRWIATLVALPLAVFTAVFLWPTGPQSAAVEMPRIVDRENGQFDLCHGSVRVTCVVDGDTIWYGGEKIRLADINAPEVSSPGCAAEAELGRAATERLLALLNEAPFSVEANSDGSGRDSDVYGRSLRTLTRDGQSLGQTLVREGLAEEWRGYRGGWC